MPQSKAPFRFLLSQALSLAILLAAHLSAGFSNPQAFRRTSALFAEGGPQYEKHGGLLQKSECVGKGSYLLTIDYEKDAESDEWPCYESGHVLALEIQSASQDDDDDDASYQMTDKTKEDSQKNDGWMRGPYTVSFGYGTEKAKKDGFKVLVKEVGYKSHVFATSPPGTPVRFGGKFKVPIAEGIREAAASSDEGSTQRVVLISSGVGVGPCVGAVEELLEELPSSIASIDLIPSYRTREEICMESALESLQSSSESLFQCNPIVTSEEGRLASKGPEALQERLKGGVSPVTNTHYHIIGNGQLVNEWKEGLEKAGVPASRVTVEAYFNHSAKPDSSAIDTICQAIIGLEKRLFQKQRIPKNQWLYNDTDQHCRGI